MISSGRIRQVHHRKYFFSLLLGVVSLTFVGSAAAEPEVEIGGATVVGPIVEIGRDETVESSTVGKNATLLEGVPIHLNLNIDGGYDDNITASAVAQGAWFTSEQLSLSYDHVDIRTQIHLIGGGGLTRYFDSNATQDENGNITLSLVRNITPRLSLSANAYATYQVEPQFNVNVGPENVRANHFYTSDAFSLGYRWLPRFTLITSYTFGRVKYDDISIGFAQDRTDMTLGEIFQFSRSLRTNVFGEYRYHMVDYDNVPNDSTTHYAVIGFEHKFTEYLTLNARGGETYRSFQLGGDRVDPYFESSLNYGKPGLVSLAWSTSYGVEESGSTGGGVNTVNVTLRTGLQFSYNLFTRTIVSSSVYYNHATTEGATRPIPETSQDSLSLSVGLRYFINQRFSFHLDYNRSQIESSSGFSDYSRNRYSVGLIVTY